MNELGFAAFVFGLRLAIYTLTHHNFFTISFNPSIYFILDLGSSVLSSLSMYIIQRDASVNDIFMYLYFFLYLLVVSISSNSYRLEVRSRTYGPTLTLVPTTLFVSTFLPLLDSKFKLSHTGPLRRRRCMPCML